MWSGARRSKTANKRAIEKKIEELARTSRMWRTPK
jgi:hypothetical protein